MKYEFPLTCSVLYDCIIVGGGPAGSSLAGKLAAKRAEVLLLEEHPSVGRPVQCAGIVSPESVRLAGYDMDRCRILKTAHFISEAGEDFLLKANGVKAVFIDREDFDRSLWNKAGDLGAETRADTRFTGLSKEKDGVTVKTDAGTFHGRYLVGADGIRSKVARQAGFPSFKEVMPTLGADIPDKLEIGADVRIDLGKNVAPGFFGWAMPFEGFTRLHLGSNKGGLHHLVKKYMRILGASGSVIGWHTGSIPLSMRDTFARGRMALLGDSAGQVKPLSGGGIYPLLVSSGILADALLEHDFTERATDDYVRNFEDAIGKELSRGEILRKAFLRVEDSTIAKAFKAFSREEVADTISTHGDLDHPSQLAKKLLLNYPALLKLAPMVARDLL